MISYHSLPLWYSSSLTLRENFAVLSSRDVPTSIRFTLIYTLYHMYSLLYLSLFADRESIDLDTVVCLIYHNNASWNNANSVESMVVIDKFFSLLVSGCYIAFLLWAVAGPGAYGAAPVGPSDRPEAYFNGSSYIRLSRPISLKQLVGLSFRTCVGELLPSIRCSF